MVEVLAHVPGTFCFLESGSADVETSSHFYEGLFGWRAEEHLLPEGSSYMRFLLHGKPVAGLYGVAADRGVATVPSQWLSYVCVDNAVAALEKAVALGATPFGNVVEVPEVVTVAEFVDPEGALCGLWQPGTHVGASYVNEPGALSWNDLLTSDCEAAAFFYGQMFDWKAEATSSDTSCFYGSGGIARGSMSSITAGMGSGPPQWRAHVGVADLDTAGAAIRGLGGLVKGGPTTVPGVGSRLGVEDPNGISFMLIEISPHN